MREIKFKAKRVEGGVWVYGYYCELAGRKYIIPDYSQFRDIHDADLEDSFTEIIPETICQFTGLKDKNGVEIYEGDIVEFVTFFTKDTVVEHVWIDEHACLHPFFDLFYIDGEQGAGMEDETIKVLGNIHDNPELLK